MDKFQCSKESIALTRKTVARFKAAESTEFNRSGLRYWRAILSKQLAAARGYEESERMEQQSLTVVAAGGN